MDTRLSEGTIEAINKGISIANAVLQVVNLRKIDGAATRYRLMMSDGRHSFSSFMLASQLNCLVDEGHLEVHCVCNVRKTTTNTIRDGRPDQLSPEGCPEPPAPARGPAPAGAPPPPQSPPTAASSSRGGYGRGYGRGKKMASVSPLSPGPSPTKPAKVVPIASLNPYQTKWTVRARVTHKSSIRTWNNSRGEGKLFSFEIVDESGEIRITAFNKEADKFFSLVEAGKVYYISRGTLKPANKKFNPLKNDYEMSLHADSSILPCEQAHDLPVLQCDFVPIAELENHEKDAVIDVIGLCRHAEDVSKITTKSSREVSKRAFHLLDSSGKEVTVTLWGEEAERFDGTGQPVVAIKGARLSDFGGRSLSALFSSTVMVNPDLPEAFRLRSWYDREGHAIHSQSLSAQKLGGGGANVVWKTLCEVKQEHLGQGEKADYFSCVATVLFSRKDSCVYRACPSSDCNKKLVEQQDGSYRCERCDRSYDHFQHRLILSANIADFGDNQWVTCFQETAEALLGHSAETLGRLQDTNEAAFDEVFQKANFTTHVFRNRIKMETYNDEARVKATVMDVKPVDHREYSRRLIRNIREMAV